MDGRWNCNFSNQKLPAKAKAEDLLSYKWVCRNPESNTRLLFKENLEKANYPDCDTFNVTSEVTSANNNSSNCFTFR